MQNGQLTAWRLGREYRILAGFRGCIRVNATPPQDALAGMGYYSRTRTEWGTRFAKVDPAPGSFIARPHKLMYLPRDHGYIEHEWVGWYQEADGSVHLVRSARLDEFRGAYRVVDNTPGAVYSRFIGGLR